MIGEISKVFVDIDKGIGKNKVDITKRIDSARESFDISCNRIDITKRIIPDIDKEMEDIDLSARNYLKDLKIKSPYTDTLFGVNFDFSKLEVQDPERVAELREKFVNNKSFLRNEWEKVNNKEWPKYKEDIYNNNGIRIRKVGDCYDVHHIVPLQLGGTNEVSNLTPLDLNNHHEIHSGTGSCTRLVEAVKGVEKI